MTQHEITNLTYGYALQDLFVGLLAVLCWLIYRRVVARWLKPLPETAAWPWWKASAAGLAWGVIALAFTLLPAAASGGFSPGQPGFKPFIYANPEVDAGLAGAITTMFFFQSLFEELIFRAVAMLLLATLLFWLHRVISNPGASAQEAYSDPLLAARSWFWSGLAASVITAVAFSLRHSENPNISSMSLVNIALAGIVLGQVYWMHSSLPAAWALHFVWNAGLAMFGLPISGFALSPPYFGFGMQGAVPGPMTGGEFGPEAGLPCSIALSLVFAVMLLMTWRGLPTQGLLSSAAAPGPAQEAQV